MLAGMTREEFNAWRLSDELDHTLSGLERLTGTVAHAAAALVTQVPLSMEWWQFIPGEKQPDDTDAEIDAIPDRIAAGLRAIQRHQMTR